ncbi:unnamed protein product [Lepeophtheirus salmonis]|uniref:(salmon louse) hypothetical protein n=1 Tax=Lepeophtheirus salmonis TaxID=72036 RepID=A0A7R8CCG8_LEPSM|nr:unnamed protein product [Lepeophtheirus salmonis]CAF2770716.1 unnamed protein product [Lepeophtheirus salmonis]
MIVLDDVLPSSPPPLMDTKALEPPITSSASATSQFTCEMCHKSFPQKYRLTRHVEEVHEQVKNFICPFQGCSKAFFKKTSITRHSLTHLKDSIYHCENCWKKFKDPSGLKYHVAKGVCTKKDSSNKN